jgi:hypothetical protein
MAKSVVVTGDVFVQEDLFIGDSPSKNRTGAHRELDVQEECEGSWRLSEMLQTGIA